MNENFGIMDQAYFVGRKDIINWVNGLLEVIYLLLYDYICNFMHLAIFFQINIKISFFY